MTYLQCQVAPLTTTATVKCDCEKQVTDNPVNNGRTGTETSAARQRPDEPFSGSPQLTITWSVTDPPSSRNLTLDQFLPGGHSVPVFQPPRV